ncbi:DEKNAAC103243 [Brettanomyces naardenensis]|uniref:DEKNAAC103243 n=1 Tax=Brettanomyces naardenensis TaxID=13370 RepID=A0A448YMX8_BRENA|nr:DEKNAAC103243 [Brettanomyces naardenensis]
MKKLVKKANSALRSYSPSSESGDKPTPSSSSASSSSKEFKGLRYKGRPPISEVPELLILCEEFISNKNVTGLAMIARQRGLPPSLRCKIWPVLLRYHPYVQHPYIEPDFDEDEDDDEEEVGSEGDETLSTKSGRRSENAKAKVSIKDIKFDLKKYLRNAERYKPKNMTPELRDLFEIQDKMFGAIECAIVKFVKKWGSIIRYSSGLTWIALGLAEWVPPLQNSQFVLCGRDDIAKNGTKLRNVNDNYFERYDSYNQEFSSNTPSTVDSTPTVPGSPKSVSSLGTSSLLSDDSSTTPSSVEPSYPFKPMTFAEVYERIVLVILHTPDPTDREGSHLSPSTTRGTTETTGTTGTTPSSDSSLLPDSSRKLDSIPKFGGTIEDRISFFLFGLRKLMPELYSYLADEDCLKGDWILWWLKYCGSKVWSRYDRGRTWDMLLGFRVNCRHMERDLPLLGELTEEQVRLLGPDLFWYPEIDDLSVNNGYNGDAKRSDRRSSSILTLLNQVSVTMDKTPTLASLSISGNEDVDPLPQLPFSVIDPHIQMVFVSLAFLKSKEYTISELDQSEIIQLFSRLSSLKTSEIRSFVSAEEATADQHYHPIKKSNRDIENIILEGGELWRKFIYMEMMEEHT